LRANLCTIFLKILPDFASTATKIPISQQQKINFGFDAAPAGAQ
jgi:hypothetical protein